MDDQRLALAIRDGIVLEAFRLEHNRNVSKRGFLLNDNVYRTLVER